MAFPVSPTNGQTAVVNGIVYLYNSADNAWSRFSTPPGNLTVTGNLTSGGNIIASNIVVGNIYFTTMYWANNVPISFAGTYSNANVASYLPINPTIISIQANLGAYQQYANANIGAYQTYANANIGAYQQYANANIGAYQTYANANVAAIQANIGAFYTYANTKIGNNANGNLVVAATTPSTSTTTGALVVGGGAGIAGDIFASGNLTAGNVTGYYGTFSSNLSIAAGTTLADVLDLNNNNLYNVNTIRINDPGTSEGIVWEGGSGWYIYESPNDLSNDIGNLQVVLNGTRTFTIASDGTVDIPNTHPSISTTTGALTVGGGLGVAGRLYADRVYTFDGLYWAANGEVISTGGGGGTLDGLSDVIINSGTLTSGQVLKYNGSEWVNGTDSTGSGGGGGGSGITFTADAVAPVSANVADQWYDTATDILFEYINDGDSNQWVDITSGPIAANTRVNISSGNLQIAGYFLPAVDNTYDLGTPSFSWRNLQLDGRATVGNITTTSGIFYSNGASASYANTRVAQYLPVYSGNISAANLTPVTAGGNINVGNGNLALSTGSNLVIRNGFITGGDTGQVGVSNSTLAVSNGNITVMSGSVGIGTVTPVGSLEVAGDVLLSNSGNLTVSGNIIQQEAYYEIYSNVVADGGNLTCDFSTGTIFNVTDISSNVTANFTNVNSLNFAATAATVVIKQAASAYIVSNIQINGVMQTINWANGIGNQSAPAGLANNTDVISFSMLHLGSGTWRVLGQLGSYA